MRWVKSDTVLLDEDRNIGRDQIQKAVAERFPLAWDFLTGEFDIDDKRLATELRMLQQFMASNWLDARHQPLLSFEEWHVIFDALRYAAEKIGYLPKTKRMDVIRDQAKKISGKLLQMNVVSGLGPDHTVQYEDLPIYPGDWMVMLQCMHYVATHVKHDDPDIFMRELRKNVDRLAATVANRVKYHEHRYLSCCGIKEVDIHKRIEDMMIVPWEKQDNLKKKGLVAVQGEHGYIQHVPLNKAPTIDPKEEFESRPEPFEGEPMQYPKDIPGIEGVDYKVITGLELERVIKGASKPTPTAVLMEDEVEAEIFKIFPFRNREEAEAFMTMKESEGVSQYHYRLMPLSDPNKEVEDV